MNVDNLCACLDTFLTFIIEQPSQKIKSLEDLVLSFKKMFEHLNEKGEKDPAINGTNPDPVS